MYENKAPMKRMFRSQGQRFYFKAVFIAVRDGEPERCKPCNGTGKIESRFSFVDEDNVCKECAGRGAKPWITPEPPQEFKDQLEKVGDEIINNLKI